MNTKIANCDFSTQIQRLFKRISCEYKVLLTYFLKIKTNPCPYILLYHGILVVIFFFFFVHANKNRIKDAFIILFIYIRLTIYTPLLPL